MYSHNVGVLILLGAYETVYNKSKQTYSGMVRDTFLNNNQLEPFPISFLPF
jgi:hypothetical protein